MSNLLQIKNINTAIFEWFKSLKLVASDKYIIRREQNVDRPHTGSYIGYKIISGPNRTGFTDSLKHISGSTFKLHGHREFTVSVQAFRENAMQIISDIYNSTELQSVRTILKSFNLTVIDISSPIDISTKLETGFEYRGQIDIRLGATSEQTEDQGFIDNVGITGVVSVEGNVVSTEIYTIP